METTPFFVLLFLHLGGLVLGFGAVLVTDLYGLLWIRDRVRFPQVVRVSSVTEKFIWAGWGVMVATGIPLLLLKGEVDNLMAVKIFFVALIGLNGLLLRALHDKVRGYEQGRDVPAAVLFRLSFSLLVSQIAWWGALLIGFLHRHVQSVIEWPDSPWLLIGLIAAALLALWAGGEVLVRRKRTAAEDLVDEVAP
ncbi:hypothetical protein [Blastococcus montanus]|uniref:hypothetical protein n=1 Tax=Blastococcus montanus TaxID=3144973 RepID=UPI00320AE749